MEIPFGIALIAEIAIASGIDKPDPERRRGRGAVEREWRLGFMEIRPKEQGIIVSILRAMPRLLQSRDLTTARVGAAS